MQIDKTIKNGVTLFSVSGAVSAEDIVTKAVENLVDPKTRHTIWDFTYASSERLPTTAVKRIARSLAGHAAPNKASKVALIGAGQINIGLGKMFQAFASTANLPYEYRVFKRMDRAYAWLDEAEN